MSYIHGPGQGRRGRLQVAGAALAALVAVGLPSLTGCEGGGAPPAFTLINDPRVPTAVVDGLEAGVPQRVILTLDDRDIEARVRRAMREAGTEEDYGDYLRRRKEIFDAMKATVLEGLPAQGYFLEQDYPNLPMAVLQLREVDTLARVLEYDEVVSLQPETFLDHFLTQSLGVIDQPEVQSEGNTGSGVSVAVLDTGVRYHYDAFGACAAPGGSCKVAAMLDTAPEDNKRDPDGHGTNVAGIVLGVAPGAKIIGIDVFNGASASSTDIIEAIDWCIANKATYDIVAMNMSLGGGLYSSECSGDVFAAPVANAKAAGIISVIATGNDAQTSKGASPACVPTALSVGAVYDSNIGGISWSSCTDSSTSTDKVTCFSNSPSWMDILAPGALITAATITQGGTSQATPHVAGAVAVLRAMFPSETLDQTINRLVSTGDSITDHRNGRVSPRLNLANATVDCTVAIDDDAETVAEGGGSGSLGVTDPCASGWTASPSDAWITIDSGASGSGSGTVSWSVGVNSGPQRSGTITVGAEVFTLTQDATTATPTATPTPSATPEPTPTPESDPPTDPSVVINDDDDYAQSILVTLTLSATDAAGIEDMCISNGQSCSNWIPFKSTYAWYLNSGNGTRTVFARFRDPFGNVSAQANDTVYVDAEIPRDGTLTVTPGDGQVQLDWSGFSDRHSGLAGYKVVFGARSIPASCDVGTLVYDGTDETFTHTGLTNGSLYFYRLCAYDEAGLSSLGVGREARPAPEFDAPASGTVAINAGDDYASDPRVQLTISAADASTITAMCLSNVDSCSSWVAYGTSRSWTLSGGSGSRTVYVWFKDEWENVTALPATDSILLDTTLPDDGSLSVTPGDGQVDLSWSGFSDVHSGIASYKLVFGNSSYPAHCNQGTVAYAGTGTTYSHTTVTNGSAYYYRVCAIDEAGNVSYGAYGAAIPAPETAAPTNASVEINSGDDYTSNPTVSLALAADDASTVSHMCVSNYTTCSAWIPFSTTRSWTLDAGDGVRRVYVWFRDEWGNVTSSYATDSITLDTTAPRDGTFTATAGDGQVDLAWSGFTDAHTGVASYTLVYGNKSAPTNCNQGNVAYQGTALSYSDTTVTNGAARYYRLCAVDEAGNLSFGKEATALPSPETDAPTGASVEINGGDAYTNSIRVSLAISGSDASTISRMCLSTSNSCVTWMAYSTSKVYDLTVWNGTGRVYVWLEDEWGNMTSTAATDTIYVDTTLPKDGQLSLTPASGQIDLAWSGFGDQHSGVASYKVVYGNSSIPTDCSKGYVAYEGANTSYTHTGLTDGSEVYYRVCAIDNAGNMSYGATGSDIPAPEFSAPTGGTVEINGGDEYTNTTLVSLAIAASDGSTVSDMCVTNATTCTEWRSYATSLNWYLYAGDGNKTVRVWFRDEWGNVSSTAASDNIFLDATIPNDGRLTLTPGDGEMGLEWTAFGDRHSGVVSYKVVYGNRSIPGNCDLGYVLYEGADKTTTHASLTNGSVYYYRVCAVDAAGNMSLGTGASAFPAPEFDAPANGTVVINSDDTYTNSGAVSLAISADDASTITHMCVSYTNYCQSWQSYKTARSYNLPPADGRSTIYVWFKDEWGNASVNPVTDDIIIDVTPPKDGSATATVSGTDVDWSWSNFSDKLSGLAGYRLVYGNKSYPSTCNVGNEVYAGTDTTATHSGGVPGKTYYYRLCGLDEAGNYSYGVTRAITIPLE